jgi:hypothetical protein
VLNDRMTVIDLLRDHIHGSRGSLQLGAIDHLLTLGAAARVCWRGRSRWNVPNGDLADLGVSGSGNPIDLYALVNDGVVVNHVVIDDGRVVVNPGYLGRREPVVRKIVLIEVVKRDERVMVGVQAEIEVQTHAHAVVTVA